MQADTPRTQPRTPDAKRQEPSEETLLVVGEDSASGVWINPLRSSAWTDVQRRNNYAVGVLLMLILLAFGMAVAVFLYDPDALMPERHVSFLVVGDWGRDGTNNQSEVAAAMAAVADKTKPAFIISTGDNMYEHGLLGPEDHQFNTSFSNVYSAPSLQVPWYAVLGNHDYGECWSEEDCSAATDRCSNFSGPCWLGPQHQLDVRLVQRDPRWHCARSYSKRLLQGQVELFFIDTSPAIEEYQTAIFAKNRGGILEQSWEENLAELQTALAASPARRKLVVGHHPVRFSSSYPSSTELLQQLEPVLERHHVDAYFCGHEHNLQHALADNGTVHYFISGGGSQVSYSGAPANFTTGGVRFFRWDSGFVAVNVEEDELEISFHGIVKAQRPLMTVNLEQRGHHANMDWDVSP